MYRSAAKRLFSDSHRLLNSHNRISHLRPIATSKSFSTLSTDNLSFNNAPNPNPNQHGNPSRPEPANDFLSGGKSSTGRHRGKIYEDEQARVLRASLPHVSRMGWTEAAMMAGVRDSGISPAIVGSFFRKEAALVERLYHLWRVQSNCYLTWGDSAWLHVIARACNFFKSATSAIQCRQKVAAFCSASTAIQCRQKVEVNLYLWRWSVALAREMGYIIQAYKACLVAREMGYIIQGMFGRYTMPFLTSRDEIFIFLVVDS